MSMGIPQDAVALCVYFEGFHKAVRRREGVMAVPYVCPAGYWTIGFGHLCAPDHPPVTKAQAEALLSADLYASVEASLRACPRLLVEPEFRLAAVASFVFNVGAGRLQASTLRRRINQGDWQAAGDEFLRWVHGGGRPLPGLVLRRRAERQLFTGQGLPREI